MDIIFLEGLEIETIIGIYAWERENKQPLILDIEMAFDIKKAALSHNIHDTLDYAAVAQRIVTFVENSAFLLVETLIEEIAQLLQTEFAISWVKIKLNKPAAVALAKGVGIVIERGAK
jgi:dihydroneopterin aldolase